MGQELRQGMAEWFFTPMFQSNEVTWWCSARDGMIWKLQESFPPKSVTLAGMLGRQGSTIFPSRQLQGPQSFLHGGIGLLIVYSKTSGGRLQKLWSSLRVPRTPVPPHPVCQTSHWSQPKFKGRRIRLPLNGRKGKECGAIFNLP